MYITNNPSIAKIIDKNGVDRAFIDMEYMGKDERQGGMDTVKNHHTLQDIDKVKNVLTKSELLVRVNPLHDGSKDEISEAIDRGADIVMLPMWHTCEDAIRFRDYVNGRAKVMLLLETKSAEKVLDEVLKLDGIDEIHIGLNDLHLDYKLDFMFQLLANGKVDQIAKKLREHNKFFGIGGIAGLNSGMISGKNIIAEHYRLKSKMAILSRSFCNTSIVTDLDKVDEIFNSGIKEIRAFEESLKHQSDEYFIDNEIYLSQKDDVIVNNIRAKKYGNQKVNNNEA